MFDDFDWPRSPVVLFFTTWIMLFVLIITMAGIIKLAGGYIARWSSTLKGVAVLAGVMSLAVVVFAGPKD